MFDLVHPVPVVPVCQSVQDILTCFGVEIISKLDDIWYYICIKIGGR